MASATAAMLRQGLSGSVDLMTSVSTLMAALPAALSLGPAPDPAPMAAAGGGLVLSASLNLLVVPLRRVDQASGCCASASSDARQHASRAERIRALRGPLPARPGRR